MLTSNNEVESSFFCASNISATRSHAQLIFRTVIKKVWTFFVFRARYRSQSPY